MNETCKSLRIYCTEQKRLVPQPDRWNEMYELLRDKRQKASGGWEPPLPLILAAWWETSDSEKQLRFKAHIDWADAHGQIEEIGAWLRALPESEWVHFGEV